MGGRVKDKELAEEEKMVEDQEKGTTGFWEDNVNISTEIV